jgi:transcriptional regulator with XRE-family HTH domain
VPPTFGQNLRAAREGKKLTQPKLGELAGLSPTAIYRLELGEREPRLSTILRLADALDLDGADLIRGLRR